MPRPRVFVARQIPDAGLSLIAAECDVDVWPERLPPSPDVLRERVRGCEGLVSLLTDKIDAALLDSAPQLKVISNFAVGVNNIDLAAANSDAPRDESSYRHNTSDKNKRIYPLDKDTRERAPF